MSRTVEEIGRKMDALGLWGLLSKFNFAVRPRGTVLPYFCTALKEDGSPVKVRFLMLEGWQTLHDFVRVRVDGSFGYYTSPMEMPHLELVVAENGEMRLFRHDPGYMPLEAKEPWVSLAVKILWEAYGVMLRLESDAQLPLCYAEQKAVFARVEQPDGSWTDEPLVIPDPPPYAERIVIPKELAKQVKDLPLVQDDVLIVDFRLMPEIMTKEPRPRCVYGLFARDMKTQRLVLDCRVSASPEAGLKGMWESMPVQVLHGLARLGKVPGEIHVRSPRVFRMLRPICIELPLKLRLRDKLKI